MQVKVKTAAGKVITPEYFAVYTHKNGTVFKVAQDEISVNDLESYPDIKKVELYENGTENIAPRLIDKVSHH